DVFGQSAALLCCGVPISALGPPIDPATLMPGMLPVSGREGDDLVAEVLWIDRFGNCQLNLDPAELDELAPAGAPLQVAAGEDLRTAERVSAYADVSPGRGGLLVDSSGLVSLAVPRRSVAEDLGLHEGAEVRIGATATGGSDGAVPTATRVGLGRRPAGHAGHDIGGKK
ncbi:MAG: SAM-dependent chlorinase/fluorinase, partial [Acidimicrobiaceae bacterium]|nr:SAM-dependent chlorinase/fluorinase [Acidimicrobiaceae bacterium]